MERLTDRRTAEQVRENIEGLIAAGVEPSVSDVRYVRLAEYEDKDKRGEWEEIHYNDFVQYYSAVCSVCGYESTDHYSIIDNHRYCEYCGARMNRNIKSAKDGDTECHDTK